MTCAPGGGGAGRGEVEVGAGSTDPAHRTPRNHCAEDTDTSDPTLCSFHRGASLRVRCVKLCLMAGRLYSKSAGLGARDRGSSAACHPGCMALGKSLSTCFLAKPAERPPPNSQGNSQGCWGKMRWCSGVHNHQVSASQLVTLSQATPVKEPQHVPLQTGMDRGLAVSP